MKPWLLLSASLLSTWPARADVVDRLVARVDGDAILLSDLMQHVRPRLTSLASEPAWKRAHMMRQALRAESDRAIESSLFAAWARKRKLAVSDAEVDAALGRIAAEQKLTVDELWAAAEAAGYARALYRDEIRRQLVEQRLLYSGPFGRLGPPPPAGQALTTWSTRRREQLLADLRRRACVERFGRF